MAPHPLVVLCDACGGEGRAFKSRYGGNDPDVCDAGPCPVCEGTGYAVVAAAPATMDEVSDNAGDNPAGASRAER